MRDRTRTIGTQLPARSVMPAGTAAARPPEAQGPTTWKLTGRPTYAAASTCNGTFAAAASALVQALCASANVTGFDRGSDGVHCDESRPASEKKTDQSNGLAAAAAERACGGTASNHLS